MKLNTQLLDGIMVFVAVVDCGGFGAAAEKTGHSSSYVSKEVSKLEQRLGIRLLNRTTRAIGLTPEGKNYFEQCKQTIDDMTEVTLALGAQSTEPVGTLKVSSPVGFGQNKLNYLLAEFMVKYPKVTIDLDLSDRAVDVISEGFDVAIRAGNLLTDSTLISRKIFSAVGHTLASPIFLAEHGTPQHPSELEQLPCVCFSGSQTSNVWHFTSNTGDDISIKVNQKILSNSGHMNVSLAKNHQVIARIPSFYLNDEIEKGELVRLFPEYQEFLIPLYAVYPSRRQLSTKVRSFIDFLVEKLT